jgi:uncharacterized RDD family membrane protein YckC
MSAPNEEAARFAPPRARVAEPPPAEGLVLGTRWGRLGAALIDLVIGVGAYFAAGPLVIRLLGALNRDRVMDDLWVLAGSQTLGYLLFVLLHGWLLARRGQTIGKRIVGLRIVRPDGRPAGPLRLFGLRYATGFLLMMVPALGMLYALVDTLLIFGRQRRCLHDWIAGTIVVQA